MFENNRVFIGVNDFDKWISAGLYLDAEHNALKEFELLNNATNGICLLVICDENLNIIHSDYYMIDRLIVMDDEFDIF